MTSEMYQSLKPTERVMYDELCGWCVKITARLDALTQVIEKAVAEGETDA